jgi:multidrug efflux system outer membrane protein
MARRRPLAVLVVLLAGGCKLGPDYVRPEVPLPEHWREVDQAEAESLANTPWWELFQDPVLQELIRIALQENKDLAIAIERIEEARARYGISSADLMPRVDASASAGELQLSKQGIPGLPPSTDEGGDLYSAGGSLFWELDIFGRIARATEADRAILFATEETRRAVVLALVADVASTYMELRELDRSLEISRSTLESRRAYVELARDRFEGGLTSELDWRQAQAEYHRIDSFMHDFERLVAQKENQLSVLLGRNPGPIRRGQALGELPVPAAVPAGLPAALLDRRPDLLAAEQQLASSSARIGEAKALLYPSISLTGFYGGQSTDLKDLLDNGARTWSIAGNLLQPIFNSGQNEERVNVAESQQRQALFSYEQSILQAFREVDDSLVGYEKAGQRRASEGERVSSEEKVLELAELRYRGGVSDYLEVLDAQRQLFDAQLSETGIIRDQLVALIQLYKALGGGWPASQTEPAAEPAPAEPAPAAP